MSASRFQLAGVAAMSQLATGELTAAGQTETQLQ